MEAVHRATCRGQLTKLIKQASEFLDNEDFSVSDKSELKENLSTLKERVKNMHANLKKADDGVRKLLRPEDMEKESESCLDYDDKAVTILAKLTARESTMQTISVNLNSSSSATDDQLKTTQGVKLKAMELKSFDGTFENWLPFWEQFKPTVHENPSLSAAAKFNFLSNALVGKAAITIQGFTPTEACYAEAVSLLQEEYGNTEKIIEKYIQKLLNLQPINNNNDAQAMRLLYNEVISTTRTLSALKVAPAQYTITLKSVIIKCWPKQMRVHFFRTAETKISTSSVLNSTVLKDVDDDQLKTILEYMKREIDALEKAQLSETQKRAETKECNNNTTNRSRGTATSLVSVTAKENCVFCKKDNHSAANCKFPMGIIEKKRILQKEGRCYRCTKKNHTSKFCKANYIKCATCSGKHITPMCERNAKATKEEQQKGEKSNSLEKTNGQAVDNNKIANLNTLTSGVNTEYLLQTAKAIIKNENNNKKLFSRIVMDNGSQRTYVSEKVAKLLKLKPCGVEKTTIISFGEINKTKPREYECVELNLQSQYNEKTILITAIVVPNICEDFLPVINELNVGNTNDYSEIDSELADAIKSKDKLVNGIHLLIGQDNFWKFNTNIIKQIGENLFAVKTFFGWTLQGEVGRRVNKQLSLLLKDREEEQAQKDNSNKNELCQNNQHKNYYFKQTEQYDNESEVNFDIRKFWNLESIGIVKCEHFEETLAIRVRTITGRYSAKLPWKLSSEHLRNNYHVALTRLRSLTTKLQKEPCKLIEYDAEVRNLIKQGFAESVPIKSNNHATYYMPHKPVYKENKSTTKTRIVFDASSSEPGQTSLNDHLSEGANLIADLFAMLLRFRSHQVAVVSDIEKAFLQIELDKDDRDTHRFIWYEHCPLMNKPMPELAVFRMTRVTFGVTSSPYLLVSTIRSHLDENLQNDSGICEKLKAAFYVDDLIFSEPTKEEAIKIAEHAKNVMATAKFHLRKWNSNDLAVKEKLSDNDIEVEQKVLGLIWCTLSDTILVDLKGCIDYIATLRPTKRNVVRAMAKIFDPLGFLGPFTVRVKILLQDIWCEKVQWDSILSDELQNTFIEWQEELKYLGSFFIERCLLTCSDAKMELHIFADASPKAYGAVAYCRQISPDGSILTKFVCSKNRVAPISTKNHNPELSLPKLELTAALIAARLKNTLVSSLCFEISAIYLWTDSTIALNWIGGCGRKPNAYVKARVDEITRLTNIYDWRHCCGKTNPADLLTRGIKSKALIQSENWKYGPQWLLEQKWQWPAKFECKPTSVLTTINSKFKITTVPILEFKEFSNIKKLLRVLAYVFRFIKNCRQKSLQANLAKSKVKPIDCVDELEFCELQQAEKYCIITTQREFYKNEYELMMSGNSVDSSSKISSLNPYIKDGIIRLKSRFPNYEPARDPIILPKGCHLSILLIIETHQCTFHSGVNAVLAQLRARYWIIQARQIIKSVLRKCVTCQRLHGKNATEPWAVLPANRITASRPFETTGVDFAGPLYIKGDNNQMHKAYIMLFTCAVLRAVHLELVPDMTVKSCLEALRRFVSRRGVPVTIISDNAKTFKRADKELRKLDKLLRSSEIQQLAAHQGIKWKYIPERAAWWGGFWERLVRSVKTALKASIGKANLSAYELMTLLAEIESVINSRPLTYITNDHNDLEPLTPALFLNKSYSFLYSTDFEIDQASLTQSWRLQQGLLKRYLKRWHKDYLNQLRSIHHNKKGPSRSINVGDIVLVYDELKPRLLWKRAMVKTTFMGRDGRVRSCEVQLANKQILKRSVQHLYPLEIPTSFPGAEDVENHKN